MNIYKITRQNFDDWVSMGVALWPNHSKKEIAKEFNEQIRSKKYQTFIYKDKNNQSIAFINLSLRTDYVDGSSSSPIVYIEGIYVKPKYRKQGIAQKLIQKTEKWAQKLGCQELGSDTELDNINSQKFHKKLGFQETNRTVNFIKKIKNKSKQYENNYNTRISSGNLHNNFISTTSRSNNQNKTHKRPIFNYVYHTYSRYIPLANVWFIYKRFSHNHSKCNHTYIYSHYSNHENQI